MACMTRLIGCGDFPIFMPQILQIVKIAGIYWTLQHQSLSIISINLHNIPVMGGSFTLLLIDKLTQRRQSFRVLQLEGVELEFNPGLGDSAAHGFNFAGLLLFLCILIGYFQYPIPCALYPGYSVRTHSSLCFVTLVDGNVVRNEPHTHTLPTDSVPGW